MKGIRQHPKVFVFVSILVMAFGALIARNVLGEADGGTVNEGIYSAAWEISVYNLSYNSSTQRTRSTHRYLLENSGDSETGGIIKRKYTFLHEVLTADGNPTFDADDNPKVLRIESGIGAPLSPGEYQEYSDTIGLSIADLEGGTRRYKIHAYTRLSIYENIPGPPLAQPEVHETSNTFRK